jgi:MFS family permease
MTITTALDQRQYPRWIITALLAGLNTLGPFSIDTYFPAFDAIGLDLQAGPIQMQQTLSVYLLGFALMLLFHGSLSDAFGRRPIILIAQVVFTLASIGCALSTSIHTLIVFRFVQGLSAVAGMVVGRAIGDLDLVDWPEPVKHMQRNWIGASQGASIDFAAAGRPGVTITVFTTRPDTLPGATYLALSPEHPLIAGLTAPAWPAGTPASWRYRAGGGEDAPAAAVAAYQARAAQLAGRAQGADHDRTVDKTGVFTGSYVVNPATGEQMPVLVADYVLMDYGTGAIMAVPAHDQRDMEFARAFGLPVRAVLQPPDEWFGQHCLPAGAPAGEWPQAFTGDGRYAPVPGPPLAGLGYRLAR